MMKIIDKKNFIILLFFLLIALPEGVRGAIISDPENVTYMVADVTQSGHVRLNSLSGSSIAEELRLVIYVPQNDSRQRSEITRVIGPGSYRMGLDEHGNAQIILEWKNPPLNQDINYLVETMVEVETGSSQASRDFQVTELTRPTASIIEDAYMVGGGGMSVENMLKVGAWVNGYVEYDLTCENVTMSADWVYSEGRGTCDEYSNLFLSMMRVLGYRSWYVAGYAYLGGKQVGSSTFGAHAWNEVRLGGETHSIDSTWGESPVDATHIAMARLPDSNFTELTEAKTRDVEIGWGKDDTVILLKGYREGPRIGIQLEPVPASAKSGKNVLFLADLTADGCVLSVASLASCISMEDKRPLFDINDPKKTVVLCGEKKLFWTAAATANIRPGLVYTCPVTAAAGGAREGARIPISHEIGPDIELDVSTQKILVPGQSLEVMVSASNPGFDSQSLRVFAMLGDQILEKDVNVAGNSAETVRFGMKAPQQPGDYTLTAFSSSGEMLTESITVISERQLKITEISIPGKTVVGDNETIIVTMRNFGGDAEGKLDILIGDHHESHTFLMVMNSSKVMNFSYSAGTAGEKVVSIALLDSGGMYQDAWVGRIEAIQPVSFKEGIAKQLEDFFLWLLAAIRSLFGQ